MANPTSTGLGQGLAQVFTGTRAADIFAYQQQLEQQRAIQRAKEAQKAQQELSGKYDDLYKADLFETRDSDWYYGQVQAIKDKYAGNMEALAKNTNPALTRQFQDDILKLRLAAKQSKAVKDQLKEVRQDMFTGPNSSLYPEEEKQKFESFISKENAGNMEVPTFKRKSGIDIDKYFTEKIYTPTAKMAADMFTRDGYFEQELPSGKKVFVNSKNTAIPKEVAEEQWNLGLTDPNFILAINERFGDEAEAKGVDPIQLAHDFYVPRLMIKKSDLSASSSGDGEGDNKSFDPSYITTFNREQSKSSIDASKGEGELFPKVTASSVKDAPFYPINYPVTVQTSDGAIDWQSGAPLKQNAILSGTVAGYTVIPTKNNRIDKNGSQGVHAVIRTTDGYDVVVPVEQVANQGKQKGYDVENIVNGLYQSVQKSTIPTATMSEWKAAGWNDEQINAAVSQGKIKLK